MCLSVHVGTYRCVCGGGRFCVCMCMHVYVCMCLCVSICMYVYMCVCVHAWVYVHVRVSIRQRGNFSVIHQASPPFFEAGSLSDPEFTK